MSLASKITFAATSLAAASTVYFVHYGQQAEKAVRPPFLLLNGNILYMTQSTDLP